MRYVSPCGTAHSLLSHAKQSFEITLSETEAILSSM